MIKINRYKYVFALLFVSVVAIILSGGKVQAASLTVNSLADTTVQDDGECTFREAILNVNAGSDTTDGGSGGDCIAGDGNSDTITIPSGTINLSAGLPPVTQPAAIIGQGIGQTIINGGSGQYPVIINSTNLSIKRLTVTGFKDYGIYSQDNSIVIDQVEVDGSNSIFQTGPNSGAYGVVIVNRSTSIVDVNVSNLYVHDMTSTSTNLFPLLISTGRDTPGSTGDLHATVSNVTIANISGDGNVFALLAAAGMNSFGYGTGATYLDASNITVSGIHSNAGPASGIIIAAITPENRQTTAILKNITVTNISGLPNPLFGGKSGAGIIALTGGFVDGVSNVVNLDVQNALIADTGNACGAADASGVLGSNATGIHNFVSLGGNLTDDNSCVPYFTQSTDQNNVAALAASLLPLANNGGYVPTMALKQNSPAIDSGLAVAGLTTDARLSIRPQGLAFDSGAYESPYTKTSVATLASTGQSLTLLLGSIASIIILSGITLAVRFKQTHCTTRRILSR